MNILMVGGLWPNEDRIFALSRHGHKLVYGYTAFSPVIPLLESEIICTPLARRYLVDHIRYLIAQHEIHLIYCLLHSYDTSNEIAVELIDAQVEVPIVRHYKEHPCLFYDNERRALIETDAQIYINERSLEYFCKVYGVHTWSAHILDGDMIAERYMTDSFSPKLRAQDGEPHLLVAGNLSILNDRQDVRQLCVEMNKRRVHVHLYGSYVGRDEQGFPVVPHAPTRRTYERLVAALPYVHQHPYIRREEFTSAWSCYDAGMMHTRVGPDNDAFRFEQMNYPYRYSAYLAAGLPLALHRGGQDAMEELAEQHRIGLLFNDYHDLAEQLYDHQHIAKLTESAIRSRKQFSFDHHVPELIGILSRYARI